MATEGSEETNRCSYFENLFSPYISGSLDKFDRRALADHLRECAQCAEQFGLSWRAAAQEATAGPARSLFGGTRSRRGPSRTLLWTIMIGSAISVVVLGASGLLDHKRPLADAIRRKPLPMVEDAVARMISVQTDLLSVLVDPLRGSQLTLSHALRGEAQDFFDSLANCGARRPTAEGLGWEAHLHSLFRAVDPVIGGREWERREFLEELDTSGLPPIVLVSVMSATRRVILCSITWGKRPAFAFLVREKAGERSDTAAQRESAGPLSIEDPFLLTYLLLSRP